MLNVTRRSDYVFKELMTFSTTRIYRMSRDRAILAEVRLSDLAYNDVKILTHFEIN